MKNFLCSMKAVINGSVDVGELLGRERAVDEIRSYTNEIMGTTMDFYIHIIIIAAVFMAISLLFRHGSDICDFFSDLDPLGFLFRVTGELSASTQNHASESREKEKEKVLLSEREEENEKEREAMLPKMEPVKPTIKKKTVICKNCAGAKLEDEKCPYCGIS